jgi:hypothetical protein
MSNLGCGIMGLGMMGCRMMGFGKKGCGIWNGRKYGTI